MAQTTEVDVLVAGGGNAALCAAIQAARDGASVLVVESATQDFRGGNTRHTRNMRLAHDEANATLTGPYPVDEFLDDLLGVTDGQTDEALARLLLEESTEMWDWMTGNGVTFAKSLEGSLSLGRTNAFFLGGGRAMLNALYRTARELGVEVRYETEVVDVACDPATGRFESATVVDRSNGGSADGARATIRAGAFVAASGGFQGNDEWMERAWGPQARNFIIRGTANNKGVVLAALERAGVELTGDPTQCHAVAVDGRAPRSDGGIVTRLDCVPFGVVVNADGHRFYDEGEDFWPKRYAIWGRLVAAQPNQVGYVLIDDQSSDAFMPSVFPPVVADSIPELATSLGLDPTTVTETVDAFNRACRPGTFTPTELDDCRTEGLDPPKSHWARPLTTPPFSAYTVRCGITFTYLAVRIDRRAALRMTSGAASPNMFAAGEIMAGNILGKGYLAGLGMTIGSVFGRIAGASAAAAVQDASTPAQVGASRTP
ncbi:MAG: FAD-dependent tricarballylate dehydrogenase TcuA [Actinomycetota bacterium]